MRHCKRLLPALIIVLAAPAAAQQQPPTRLIDELDSCLSIIDDAKRLNCTDGAARRLIDATRAKRIVIVDEAEVKSTRRSLFGFQLPRVGLFGRNGPDTGEELDLIETKITDVRQLGRGKFALTVDGGARWETTEAWGDINPPARGATTTIRKGIMGGYLLKVGSGRAVRAMRTG